jgi:hypothetical protein
VGEPGGAALMPRARGTAGGAAAASIDRRARSGIAMAFSSGRFGSIGILADRYRQIQTHTDTRYSAWTDRGDMQWTGYRYQREVTGGWWLWGWGWRIGCRPVCRYMASYDRLLAYGFTTSHHRGLDTARGWSVGVTSCGRFL